MVRQLSTAFLAEQMVRMNAQLPVDRTRKLADSKSKCNTLDFNKQGGVLRDPLSHQSLLDYQFGFIWTGERQEHMACLVLVVQRHGQTQGTHHVTHGAGYALVPTARLHILLQTARNLSMRSKRQWQAPRISNSAPNPAMGPR